MTLIYTILTGLFPEESQEALAQAEDLIVQVLIQSF